MYNKLFTKILDSSIWLEPSATRVVWITLLAAMDQDGYAHFSAVENLASRARVTVEEAAKAVECFMSPDPNSETPDHEGRRVERVPGGFMVLNAAKHRGTLNRVVEREQNRERVARCRAKKKEVSRKKEEVTKTETEAGVTIGNDGNNITPLQTLPPSGNLKPRQKPNSIEECIAYADRIGMLEADARKWFKDCEDAHWHRANGEPYAHWQKEMQYERDRKRTITAAQKPKRRMVAP